MTYPQRLLQGFRELSELVPAQETVRSTLDIISTLAVRTIPGCDVASVSLVKPDAISTVGSSHDVAVDLDAFQYTAGEGPCLDAIGKDAMWFQIDEMATDETWPRFATMASEHGFESLLALTLRVDADTLGALNLYARDARAFVQEDRDYGAIFAAHAAVTLGQAQARADQRRTRDELTEEIVTQEMIGRAVGILMEGELRNAGDALELLEARAEALKIKLRDGAQDVVDSAERRIDLPLPTDFADRTMSRARTEKKPRWRLWRRFDILRRPFLGAILVVVSVALAAGAGVYFRDGEAGSDAPATQARAAGEEDVVGLTGSSAGEARLVGSRAGSTMFARGLEELDSGRTYQLWLFRDGVVVASRTFVEDDGVAVVEIPYPPSAFGEAAVTVEPSGGSEAPTTDPVLESV